MLDTPHYQFYKMEDLRHNAKQARFPDIELNHKIFRFTEKMNWKVLEVGTEQNGVKDLPLLVDEQVLLGVLYLVYSQGHVNGICRIHNECRNNTNLFESSSVKNGVSNLVQFAGSVENNMLILVKLSLASAMLFHL